MKIGRMKQVESRKEVILRVTSRHDFCLENILHNLAAIQHLSKVGASRTVSFYVDGDGASDLEFEVVKGDFEVKMQDKIDLDGEEVKLKGLGT